MIGQSGASGQACTRRSGLRTSLRGGVPHPAAAAPQQCNRRPSLGGCRRHSLGGRCSQGGAIASVHDEHSAASCHDGSPDIAASHASASVLQPTEASASAAQQPQQQAGGPFASITRMLLVGQPSIMFRSITNRRMPAGPISLLLFIFALVAAMVASIRSSLVRRSRTCSSCNGYGVVRCYLCQGSGRVDWRAKFGHYENCPLCMNRRFTVCTSCGGYYNKPIFLHIKRDTKAQSDVFNSTEERV